MISTQRKTGRAAERPALLSLRRQRMVSLNVLSRKHNCTLYEIEQPVLSLELQLSGVFFPLWLSGSDRHAYKHVNTLARVASHGALSAGLAWVGRTGG